MLEQEAIDKINQLHPRDPDIAHPEAERIILEFLHTDHEDLAMAFETLRDRCSWWAFE